MGNGKSFFCSKWPKKIIIKVASFGQAVKDSVDKWARNLDSFRFVFLLLWVKKMPN